jgi:hypothetical protein
MEIADNQPAAKMEKEVKNALWIDVLTFLYTELFGKEMFDFATTFNREDLREIVAADRIIDVQLEPYELFFVRMNGGMIEYISRNQPEMISREVDLKSSFANYLSQVWWTLVSFNHPKELYGKNIELRKGYKIAEGLPAQSHPLAALLKGLRGG